MPTHLILHDIIFAQLKTQTNRNRFVQLNDKRWRSEARPSTEWDTGVLHTQDGLINVCFSGRLLSLVFRTCGCLCLWTNRNDWKTVLAESSVILHSKPNVINKIHIYNKYTVRNSSLQYMSVVSITEVLDSQTSFDKLRLRWRVRFWSIIPIFREQISAQSRFYALNVKSRAKPWTKNTLINNN